MFIQVKADNLAVPFFNKWFVAAATVFFFRNRFLRKIQLNISVSSFHINCKHSTPFERTWVEQGGRVCQKIWDLYLRGGRSNQHSIKSAYYCSNTMCLNFFLKIILLS